MTSRALAIGLLLTVLLLLAVDLADARDRVRRLEQRLMLLDGETAR